MSFHFDTHQNFRRGYVNKEWGRFSFLEEKQNNFPKAKIYEAVFIVSTSITAESWKQMLKIERESITQTGVASEVILRIAQQEISTAVYISGW